MASEVVGYEVDVAGRVGFLDCSESNRKYPLVFREGPVSVSAWPSRTRKAP